MAEPQTDEYVYALTYLGETLDLFDTLAEAWEGRRDLVARIKRNQIPDFLCADDIEGVSDFGIHRQRYGG